MRTRYLFLLILPGVFPLGSAAQTIGEADLLQAVERHSPGLQSAAATARSNQIEARTGNTLPNPELEYIHSWGSSGAVGEDEFTATQGFDFPTAYVQRTRAARAREDAAQASYRQVRMETLLQARLAVQEILYLQKRIEVDSLRLADAEFARQIARVRAQAGDITSIEENRIEFQSLSARNNLTRTRMALETALTSLSSLSGLSLGADVQIEPMPLPALAPLEQVLEQAYAADPALSAARASGQAAQADRRLAVSLALPKFSAGYKYSSSDGAKFHGVVAGMSIPLFESRNTVRLARARQAEVEATTLALETNLTADLTAKYSQACRLEAMSRTYQSGGEGAEKSALLRKALQEGSLTILEYFTELDPVYRHMDEINELSYNYRSLLIELNKYAL